LFKKVVIADHLAQYVNIVYNNPTDYHGGSVWLATYFFAFQIYCDFSGYSDIALGSARILGYNLIENFRQPYFSKSISEFWQRWHISLSTWFRDYIYIPLGGNRVGWWRWQFNLLAVFLLSGLWHGANWTFVIWGALHGLYIVAANVLATRINLAAVLGLAARPGLRKALNILVTFHLVCFAWIFFRANSVTDAFLLIQHLFQPSNPGAGPLDVLGSGYELTIACLSLVLLFGVERLQVSQRLQEMVSVQPTWVRWATYYAVIMLILLFGAFAAEQQFIYFQF